ncbi:MAG: hypothetical protein HZC14_00220 [Candidatus Niyogibacteria bacterium]|nr:hypothetical protein [Candidatus Niyogibacteria bacterium]
MNSVGVEKIFYKNILAAIRVKALPKGSVPVTSDAEFLQLLTLKHKKGYQIKPHAHISKRRITKMLQECLVVRRGKIRVDFYAPNKKIFKYVYVKAGEALIILRGGHGVRVMQDAEIFELKNGPFVDDKVFI